MNLAGQLYRRPWAGRVLALCLLALVLFVVAFVAEGYLSDQHRHYDQVIDQRLNQIEGYRRVASNRPALIVAKTNIEAFDTSRYYLKNSSPSLAAAEIQETAQTTFDSLGMKVNSVSIAPHKDVDGRRKITLNLNIRGTVEATQKLLYALETKIPYLFIDNLTVRSTINSRRWQPTPMVEPEVQVQFDLSGYALIGKLK